MEHEYVVILPVEEEEDEVTALGVIRVIWKELRAGLDLGGP